MGGGIRGGPWTALPGAPSDLNPPSALPEWAMVMGGVMGGAAPILFWCAAVCRPQAWSARRSGVLVWARPSAATPRVQADGGSGARGVQVQSQPPPPRVAVPSEGGGASPRLRGGGGSLLWLSSWGGGAGGGDGGAAPPPPAPPPRRTSACHPLSPARLPGVYSCRQGCQAAIGVGRGPVGRQCGGGGQGGGGNPPALVCAPAFPRLASERAAPFAPSWAPPVRRRSAAGRAGACGRFTGGDCRGRGAPSTRVRRPLRGWCGAAVSSVCLCPLLGLRGRGEEWGGPSGPQAPPPDSRGGAAWRSPPRGPAGGWGVTLFPRPPLPRAGPSCRPSLGSLVPPAVAARRWPARGSRKG